MEKTTPTKEAYDLKTATPTTIGETVVYLTEAFGDPSIGDSPLVSSLHDAMVVEIETLFEKTEYVDVDELPPKVQEYILGADLMQVFLESLSE